MTTGGVHVQPFFTPPFPFFQAHSHHLPTPFPYHSLRIITPSPSSIPTLFPFLHPNSLHLPNSSPLLQAKSISLPSNPPPSSFLSYTPFTFFDCTPFQLSPTTLHFLLAHSLPLPSDPSSPFLLAQSLPLLSGTFPSPSHSLPLPLPSNYHPFPFLISHSLPLSSS
jgi:hypothetical protein